MGNGLDGMTMGKRRKKELTRMEKKMGNGLDGMQLSSLDMKKLTRMGKRFLQNVGMKMEMIVNVVRAFGKVVNDHPFRKIKES
jgi:hypothetical protein